MCHFLQLHVAQQYLYSFSFYIVIHAYNFTQRPVSNYIIPSSYDLLDKNYFKEQ